jgi:Ca2+-transporting ATPase
MLLDDDFGSIVTTIRLGRRIYDNLRKAMSFILAVHVPIAGLALMPLLFGMPLMFAPIHIAFLEMVIDPVCSLVFEAEEAEDGIMRRPPRPILEPLFSGPTVVWSLLQGALVLLAVGSIVALAPGYGMSEGQTRALGFASLILSILVLILVDRATTSSLAKALFQPNRALFVALPARGVRLCQPALALAGPAARRRPVRHGGARADQTDLAARGAYRMRSHLADQPFHMVKGLVEIDGGGIGGHQALQI